jgi:type I restriction enzyme S subunit
VPAAERQRAIADYLDAEVARTDAVVSARNHQIALTREHLDSVVTGLLHACGAKLVPLGRVVEFLAGFPYTSPDFLQDGGAARLLRGINVDVGATRWDDCVWVSSSIALATTRFALATGDVVMGMDRPVISAGVRVAQVQDGDLPAMLVQRVARLRARSELTQDYLYLALRGPGLASHFEPMFTGVSVPHVSPSQILSYRIPFPPPDAQNEIVRSFRTIDLQARRYEAATRRAIGLLIERRQALITAAVTGQLEIPGVAA